MADTTTFLSRFLYRILPQFADGPSGVLTRSTTTAGTIADTNETDLWTYSLPANTLNADGKSLRITALAETAANVNNKTVRLYVGGTSVSSSGAQALNAGLVQFTVIVTRTASGTVYVQGMNTSGVNSNSNQTTKGNTASVSADTTAAIAIKVTGLNGTANANDVVFKTAMVELL